MHELMKKIQVQNQIGPPAACSYYFKMISDHPTVSQNDHIAATRVTKAGHFTQPTRPKPIFTHFFMNSSEIEQPATTEDTDDILHLHKKYAHLYGSVAG